MTQITIQSDFQQPFTLERQVQFLEALSLCGNVRSSCRHAAITPPTAYRRRRACVHFARGWDAAMVVARAAAEEALADRALNGVEETVFYHGEEVATRRRFDSRLLLAHLGRLDAKAADRNIAEAAADFDAVLAHFEVTGALPVLGGGPVRGGDETGGGFEAGEGAAPDPEYPWDDESLPLIERALLKLEQEAGSEQREGLSL